MSLGVFKSAAIATRLAKALAGKRGDEADHTLRIELRQIAEDLDPGTREDLRRLIKIAAEELG